ncbi:cell wall-binding repeat-containing protein [Desulfosporosinus sp. Sb-LF]|uniref:cell wall-binding repeat-containing protein n=1 Tax=Desulfosporosinus sp. Sb-LF TaxID=2560027 RepID=UPI00107F817E|nr:cell wall-binding repeat-containing protein [Desulfosporosinus sp. Sb-LF]TGE31917.1 cell wall-binding repeat-containing protein [Desulfosporosinus sp. Sb-LF]
MKRTKKAVATLAIAVMALAMIPLNTLAEGAVPTRLGGYSAAQTAVQIADQTGWTGTAILASSTSYGMVDALTAGPLATYLKAPILLTEAGDGLNADTKDELTKLKVKTVYVTSGTGVISQAVLDELKGMDITVEPLGGVDRFATSANIAQKMVDLGAPVTKAAVAYGWKNQDALSIASIASAQTEPILLTEKETIPVSVKAFLTTNTSVKTTDVIGGTGVISEGVRAQLPSATRQSGNTAYDTNLAVLKAFDSVLKYDHVFIANGETAIDALAGAPLAAKYNAGIVLTNGVANEGTAYVSGKLSATSVVTAIGGTAVVPDVVRTGIVYTAPAGGGATGGGGYSGGHNSGGVSTTTYDTAGTFSTSVQGNALITAGEVKLQNLSINGDLEIAASVGDGNVYLENVTVTGQTIVKGGGQNSIHITNSNLTGALIVIRQDGRVRIVAAGSTSIPNVQLQSGVTLQNDTGSSSAFGEVTVSNFTGEDNSIDLEGDFSSVILDAPGVTISVPNGTVSALTLGQSATGSSVNVTGGTVTALTIPQGVSNTSVSMSSGNIGQLNIQSTAQVHVNGGTISAVTVASTAANTTVSVATGATVTTATLNAGTSITGTGSIGNAVINASGTTIEQSPASTTVASTVTGGASVGGSTLPAGTTESIPLVLSSLVGKTSSATNPTIIATKSGSNYSFDLTSALDSDRFTGLQLTSNGVNPSLKITSIKARGEEWLISELTAVPVNGIVATSSLLGALDMGNNGVSLANLRLVFGAGPVVLKGQLTETGFTPSSTVTVNITLGSATSDDVTTISNTWMTITKTSPTTVTVGIKDGYGATTMGTLTNGSSFDFAKVVSSMLLSSVDYTSNGGLTAAQLQTSILGNVPGYVFNNIPLCKLMGKSISFGTSPTYTLTVLGSYQ